jgi:hypothetical protein
VGVGLYKFFRRYYHEGDFIPLRRYKEGEEVKLHWANHDQYYVKSSECFCGVPANARQVLAKYS